MRDRRVQAARRDAVGLRGITFRIAGAMHVAALHAAAREDGREGQRVVATAAAGKKTTGKDDSDSVKLECIHSDCDAVFESKVPKFCHKCGKSQTVD